MAKKVIVEYIDDIDETQSADETVAFQLDGVEYEIDLSSEHAAQLRKLLAPWIDAVGRRRGASGRGEVHKPRKPTGAPAGSRRQGRGEPEVKLGYYTAIRDWARREGIAVNDRGRVANSVIAAYEAANTS